MLSNTLLTSQNRKDAVIFLVDNVMENDRYMVNPNIESYSRKVLQDSNLLIREHPSNRNAVISGVAKYALGMCEEIIDIRNMVFYDEEDWK